MVANGGTKQLGASVVIVHMCGPQYIERCLKLLAAQHDPPSFEAVVAHDGTLEGMTVPPVSFPVRLVSQPPLRTVIDLAGLGVKHARGDVVFLTEDHCAPNPDWLRSLHVKLLPGRSGVGGSIETDPDTRGATWAFYFSDFFPYAPPITEGPARALSVCNAAYRREDLEHVRASWENGFHEPTVNHALQASFGPLWLVQDAGIRVRRDVSLRDAMVERYTQGRLFAADRVKGGSAIRSVLYAALSPLLPLVFLTRMAAKAKNQPATSWRFLRSFPQLCCLVLAWSAGETSGYLTRRPPSRVIYAPQMNRDSVRPN